MPSLPSRMSKALYSSPAASDAVGCIGSHYYPPLGKEWRANLLDSHIICELLYLGVRGLS